MKMSIVALLAIAGAANAQVSYSGGSYSQNFDTLATSGTANAWANNSTIAGWSLFVQPAPGTAPATYRADNGASNSGAFYSHGATASTDRALGGVGSGGTYFGSPLAGNVGGWITVGITNDTAGSLSEFTATFDGEQWRNGGNTSGNVMVMEYGFGASFAAVTTWTAPGGSFDWTSPIATATAAAVDGNGAGLVANRGGTVTGLSWAAGETLWVRWIENNDFGNDHGLAIDNFSFSAVPTPGAAGLAAFAGLVALRRRRA